MSNASFKDQLKAVASQFSDPRSENKARQKREQREPKSNQHDKKKPKPRWLDYAHYGVELLKAYFPASFKEANEVVPLKKGIKQDLVKRLSTLDTVVMDDKACMVKSLSYYVNTAAYLKCVTEGRERLDLDGVSAGKVTIEEANYSQERFKSKQQAKQSTAGAAKATQSSGIIEPA